MRDGRNEGMPQEARSLDDRGLPLLVRAAVVDGERDTRIRVQVRSVERRAEASSRVAAASAPDR